MGSGAFLVEACRQLADALVAVVVGAPGDAPTSRRTRTRCCHARRLVAQRCLYGVDKNPFAVNLAKLSLWLVTLAKDHAFTFLDHALEARRLAGGLTKRQIGRFDWRRTTPRRRPVGLRSRRATAEARGAPRRDSSAASDDDDARKRAEWRRPRTIVEPARIVGDLCVAAFFPGGERQEATRRSGTSCARWCGGGGRETRRPPSTSAMVRRAAPGRAAGRAVPLGGRVPRGV
jgi:hypothetical protein